MRTLLVIVIAATTLTLACNGNGSPEAGPPLAGNVFRNPGFEDGTDPWFSLRPPDFTLADDVAYTGDASAHLEMRSAPEDEGTKIIYLVQEVQPDQLPEVLSGHYRVANWIRGTELQYLQFVVIVFGAANLPGDYSNHQIRYILAGVDEEPLDIANARFAFVSREDPTLDEWVPFQANVRQDFEQLWGASPEGFEMVRVLFEVRYDGKVAGQDTPEADVYYDDLYFGPAQ